MTTRRKERTIARAAVLGSGVMGSRIACHLANAGVHVLLLDRVPDQLTNEERQKGLSLTDPIVRNRLVIQALQTAIESSPPPLFTKSRENYITIGNFPDHMKDLATCDWIIEAVVENLDIKKQIFAQVDQFRRPGSLVSSNTSSIPIHLLVEGRSADFQQHFCGTHFFNPPRYLRLLEIIPTAYTLPEVVAFLMQYGENMLGKSTVLCKDTPAFIANRIGVFGVMLLFQLTEELGLTVDEVDLLTGPLIGRPKSATFRTADVIGLDTLVHVARFVAQACPHDEAQSVFRIPHWLQQMIANGWLGEKSGQGFYRKVKQDNQTAYHSINLATLEYALNKPRPMETVEHMKQVDTLAERMRLAVRGTDLAATFYRKMIYRTLAYASQRVPEISDNIYSIDEALSAGFGWQMGPFALWDALGVGTTLQQMEQEQCKPADWVYALIQNGRKTFYQNTSGLRAYYDLSTHTYQPLPHSNQLIILEDRSQDVVWSNSSCRLFDVGDGVVLLEWKTKLNSIGSDVLEGIQKSIDRAEKDFAGLIIGNQGEHFSAGANLALLFMLASDQAFDELELACRTFQNTSMRIRYSTIPVVVATHHLTLGGGCELALHADCVQAAAETYMGLVEVGVGIIPAGGGTKELTVRANDAYAPDQVEIPELQRRLLSIATAKVSNSAYEAFELDLLRPGVDAVTMNEKHVLLQARNRILQIIQAGYTPPLPRQNVRVLGRSALAAFYAGIEAMVYGKQATEHDRLILRKLAYVMCGGDLTAPTYVSEQYLLDLEREAFLSLVSTPKTLQRIQHTLKTGKTLRN